MATQTVPQTPSAILQLHNLKMENFYANQKLIQAEVLRLIQQRRA